MAGMAAESTSATDGTGSGRTCYLANLAALYRRDAELAAKLDALPFARVARLERARDGDPTVRLTADDGRAVYAHSRYRPLEEARRLVDELPAVDNPTFFVSGLGLGYHLVELKRRFERPVLIVAEDDLGLIKAALCVHDFSESIEEGRLIILSGADNRALHKRLGACNADLMLGIQFVVLPHTRRCRVEFHDEMRRRLTDFVSFARMQMVTLLKTAQVTFKNIAFNLPSYLAYSGVETLAGRAADYPAIIVAAGPSLARNLDQLHRLRERAVIIAVQTVLHLLRALGVVPHFVTSLDFHEISAEFFRGIDDVGDCTLVAEPKATWHVLDMFDGQKRVLHHRFYDALLREHSPHRGTLRPGSTVAHLALYLAQHLGCDPIIFVGQDLAFSEGMFYMPGSPIEQIWEPELNRFETVEMKQWERIVRNRSILRKVKDIRGRDTYADDLLFTYREQFENDLAGAPQKIIQATEGGVPLVGAEVMPLREAVSRYGTRRLPSDRFSDEREKAAGALQAQACAALEARIDELKQVQKIAREMNGLLEKLDGLIDRPAEFNRVIVRVDALRMLIRKYDQMYRLVIDVSAAAELRRYTADRRLGAPGTETSETARRRLRRDREFVDSFIAGCGFLERVLPEALARLRERMS